MGDVTRILEAARRGEAMSSEELLPLVYEELHRLATYKMRNEAPGHTLQPTALVHEAWMRLAGSDAPGWESRGHFFAAAAEAMRRILIERARRRLAAKRGGGAVATELDEIEIPYPAADDDQLLAVNEALEKFAALDPREAELVKLRYFVGLSFDEAAAAMGIAVPTAKQWWAYARAWLTVEMRATVAHRGFFRQDSGVPEWLQKISSILFAARLRLIW
jgi:RNA polymerase sigma factor (TIGR02999 family)